MHGFTLSSQQRHVWALPGRTGCQVVMHLVGDTKLDEMLINHAVSQVAARHEILRTRFVADAESAVPMQVIDPPSNIRLRPLSSSTSPETKTDAPFVARLVAEDADSWRLILTLSALAGDASTLDLLASELAMHCAAPSGSDERRPDRERPVRQRLGRIVFPCDGSRGARPARRRRTAPLTPGVA